MTERLKEILASIRAACGDLPEQSVRTALEARSFGAGPGCSHSGRLVS